ncbi:MAG TPA: hypothetical protein VMV40_04545 [Acidiferrobacter sp.]|nr:hypothetical protein [Acidiferrobacter sp.]
MGFALRFRLASRGTDNEITAWGGVGLMKRMLDHAPFDQALQTSGLPEAGSNLGTRLEPLR